MAFDPATTSSGRRPATSFASFLLGEWSPSGHVTNGYRFLTRPLTATNFARDGGTFRRHSSAAGRATNSTFAVTSLIDTNILVYRFDDRYPEKQTIATETLRRGIEGNSVRLPHQAIREIHGGSYAGQGKRRTPTTPGRGRTARSRRVSEPVRRALSY